MQNSSEDIYSFININIATLDSLFNELSNDMSPDFNNEEIYFNLADTYSLRDFKTCEQLFNKLANSDKEELIDYLYLRFEHSQWREEVINYYSNI